MPRALLACAALGGLAPLARAQQTTCVSLTPGGGMADLDSAFASVSADGRYVAFGSYASNLVTGDDNGVADIFVRDRSAGSTRRVSVATGGGQANGTSLVAQISADGRWVVFASSATNLTGHDTNGAADVFLSEISSSITTRISVSSFDEQASEGSFAPAVSADGRFVVFHSGAPNLIGNDSNGASDVFVRDVQSGVTTRVSIATTGGQGNAASGEAAISADGRFVAFESVATNLVFSDTNGDSDVFVRDRQNNQTARVSVAAGGSQVQGASYDAALSSDGRYVAFASESATLVPGDDNGTADVFVFDRTTSTRERVSVDNDGLQGVGWSRAPSISNDGRRIAFQTDAPNLLAPTTFVRMQVVLRDRAASTTQQLSVSSNNQPANSVSESAVITPDGLRVVFESGGSNLAPGDANSAWDVFVRDFTQNGGGPQVYCTAGASQHGCVARIATSGAASASANSGFTLSVASVEGQRAAVFFYGVGGQVAWPWADGSSSFMCVKSPLQRFAPQSTGGSFFNCDGALAVDWNAWIATHPLSLGAPFAGGDEVWAQAWYRDPGAVKNTSLSDAVHFFVGP